MRREKVGLTLEELEELQTYLQQEQVRRKLQVMTPLHDAMPLAKLVKLEVAVGALIKLHQWEPAVLELVPSTHGR